MGKKNYWAILCEEKGGKQKGGKKEGKGERGKEGKEDGREEGNEPVVAYIEAHNV